MTPTNKKICLLALVLAIVFLSVGIQTTVALQTSITPRTSDNTTAQRIYGGNTVTPNGGGDPVPGPGIPK